MTLEQPDAHMWYTEKQTRADENICHIYNWQSTNIQKLYMSTTINQRKATQLKIGKMCE